MCSYKQSSEDEPCSITYPKEVHIQRTPVDEPGRVRLTCSTSCPLVNSQTAYRWYRGAYSYRHTKSQHFSVPRFSGTKLSCAVKGLEDLRSAEVCPDDKNCWSVNYVNRRICALEGSSVNITSKYSHPKNQKPQSKLWFRIKRSSEEEDEELIEAAGRVWYHDNKRNVHTLRIKNLKENDSAEYRFRQQQYDNRWKQPAFPGVTVIVTGLKVKFTPSAVVTEDQRVTLTCSTSCPLTDNTNYIWFLNSRPLTLTENQTKHLVLDPASSQHAGNYSCGIKTQRDITSPEETLTVQSKAGKWTPAAAAGVCAALLLLIPLTVFLWIRRKKTSSQSPPTETSDNIEQINSGSLYDEISAQPTEQDELHYSRGHFSRNQTDPLYSTVQRRPPRQQEHVHYAVVNFRQSRIPA
ncbi:uncharacterized protein LOC125885504 [Epinephelus fuscoguttatus]|uniref:uncharacterized protein LOC125885504 n=1 Tax=Epinephelus fuscoguttatus TaxID=293821 RepID=UPI0020D07D44|nr:uncharacterized protein LOC125885504 [Epinephelus fuscoguttatus]